MKNLIKSSVSLLFLVVFFVFAVATADEESSDNNESNKSSNENLEKNKKKSGPGDSSCRYAVESRIKSIGGMHTGIEHKGNGMFMAFVASSTTNYEYKVVYFYTNSDCEIINVKVQ
jgi:hypothetical protein